ncbi:hypothetical protein B0H17DRAFT_1145380 [Mycena rosella]|uniref:Uncharacterized protein n=1 Tax=Mycena rosella TaxID=1033263 RepID=A0AAD7G2D4_MYCRO|nr:hypothetical protein B0H17DRAFT_1145380 [Mycena rosella]
MESATLSDSSPASQSDAASGSSCHGSHWSTEMPALTATRVGPVHPLYTLRTSLPDPSGQGEWNVSPELYGHRGRLRASRDRTIQNTPVYAHFHINYIIQEEGLRLRSALSLVKRPYGTSACSGVPPSQSRRAHPRGEPRHGHPVRLSELQSLAPVGHDVAIYINLLNPHIDQLDDLAHVAAWQARSEALANSLIEVDVGTDADPGSLTPTSSIFTTRLTPTTVSAFEATACWRKERSLSRSLPPIRYTHHVSVDMDLIMSDSSDEEDNLSDLDQQGPGTGDGASIDSPAPSFNDVCSTFSCAQSKWSRRRRRNIYFSYVFLASTPSPQARRYELQERVRILALYWAIAGQHSPVEVELLYVNHALAYHPRKAPPGRQCADTVSTVFEEEEAASLASKSKDFLMQQITELNIPSISRSPLTFAVEARLALLVAFGSRPAARLILSALHCQVNYSPLNGLRLWNTVWVRFTAFYYIFAILMRWLFLMRRRTRTGPGTNSRPGIGNLVDAVGGQRVSLYVFALFPCPMRMGAADLSNVTFGDIQNSFLTLLPPPSEKLEPYRANEPRTELKLLLPSHKGFDSIRIKLTTSTILALLQSPTGPTLSSSSPVETRPRDADFPDGNQNCAPGHKPSEYRFASVRRNAPAPGRLSLWLSKCVPGHKILARESTRIDVPAREEEHRFLTSESRIKLQINYIRLPFVHPDARSWIITMVRASTTGKATTVKKKPSKLGSNRIKTPITKAKPAKKKAAQGGLNQGGSDLPKNPLGPYFFILTSSANLPTIHPFEPKQIASPSTNSRMNVGVPDPRSGTLGNPDDIGMEVLNHGIAGTNTAHPFRFTTHYFAAGNGASNSWIIACEAPEIPLDPS